jgi:Mg/Co/Ni transporter MgtE
MRLFVSLVFAFFVLNTSINAQIFVNQSPANKVVVLDTDKSILGVIYSDDIIKLISKQSTHKLYNFAGVNLEEDVFDSIKSKVNHRYKWLMVN